MARLAKETGETKVEGLLDGLHACARMTGRPTDRGRVILPLFPPLTRGPNVLPARLAAAIVVVTWNLLAMSGAGASAEEPRPIRAGIIGLDTSHVVAFTKV